MSNVSTGKLRQMDSTLTLIEWRSRTCQCHVIERQFHIRLTCFHKRSPCSTVEPFFLQLLTLLGLWEIWERHICSASTFWPVGTE